MMIHYRCITQVFTICRLESLCLINKEAVNVVKKIQHVWKNSAVVVFFPFILLLSCTEQTYL